MMGRACSCVAATTSSSVSKGTAVIEMARANGLDVPDRGRLRPVLDRAMPLEKAAEAHALLTEVLEAPSIYDEFLAYLHRQGHDVPAQVLSRDVTRALTLLDHRVRDGVTIRDVTFDSPGAVFVVLLFVYPFLYGLQLSFQPKGGGSPFQNYITVFERYDMAMYLRTTILISLAVVATNLLFGLREAVRMMGKHQLGLELAGGTAQSSGEDALRFATLSF